MVREVVQGLGWVLRRTTGDPLALAAFYEAAVGMREVRPPRPPPARNKMIWCGDIVMFETMTRTPTREGDARVGDMIPVLRARNYDRAKTAAMAAGAKLMDETTGGGRTVRLADPHGYPFAIRQASAGLSFPPDVLADRIWKAGGVTIPNIAKLPPEIQDMASINLKVADPVAMTAFYRAALDLDILSVPGSDGAMGGAILALGRTAILELLPGGSPRGVPQDRNEVPDVWIMRVYDHDKVAGSLTKAGARVVNQVSITGGKLTYALDPEGHLFGIQQRTPDLLPEGAPERAEDKVARALWDQVLERR